MEFDILTYAVGGYVEVPAGVTGTESTALNGVISIQRGIDPLGNPQLQVQLSH